MKIIQLSELLRVKSPSADTQGHEGLKIILINKGNVLIDQIERVGIYAIKLFFQIITPQAFIVGDCCMFLEKIMISIYRHIIIPSNLNRGQISKNIFKVCFI